MNALHPAGRNGRVPVRPEKQFLVRNSLILLGALALFCGCGDRPRPRTYAGSASCKECHEKFYKLWEPSHHGKALQPWSADLAAMLPAQEAPIEAEGVFYQATIAPERGCITGDDGKEYTIAYALGGKNFYNFLTLLDDGRMQVLPIFYDVSKKSWRNTTLSMLRHFDDGQTDTPLSWRDSMLTFNAACFSCHVSQIESNYDPEADTYATVWNEPGISCESCHGPASEHIRVCKEAAKGAVPKNLEIIGWWEMNREKRDSACAGCHTKGAPVSAGYQTGDRYWDHYDLTTFEHMDYHPDGRDHGENYTMGSWWLSPCVNQGDLACTHCHTSSGRFKQKEHPSASCLPCHQQRVDNIREHSRHEKLTCVDCHMPMNPFGGMNQSDHSMRPPMPNLSIAVGSRNACVMCHKEKDHEWALKAIRSWHPDFDKHTAPELDRALLVDAMRKGDEQKLAAALAYIADPSSDPLFATTLIRLLPLTVDSRQHAVLCERLAKAVHPLVRAAAAAALDADNNPADRPALFSALSDDYRLVRIRAAERLAALPADAIPVEYRKAFDAAMQEMWSSVNIRLDHWSSSFNAGNILMRQDRFGEAAEKYDRAHKRRDDIAQPLINGAMAFARLGNLKNAEDRLLKATQLPEPSAEAHFNLGLLYGESGQTDNAIKHLYRSLDLQPQNARAACNLAILLAGKNQPETFRLLNRAIELDPYNPRYVETLAYYYMQTRQPALAKQVIQQAFQRGVNTPDLQRMYQQLP